MYDRFGLVLMVTHDCNLRCSYCYMGAKSCRTMAGPIGEAAVDRAVRSIHPEGTLELFFFGGEPLLEAKLIGELIEHARRATQRANVSLQLSITTNGTLDTPEAWRLMSLPGLQLGVSHDGLPQVHDRHRRTRGGCGSSTRVLRTIRRLLDSGRHVEVVTVVRPDTVALLPEGIAWLRDQGVRRVLPALDLWAHWSRSDAKQLEHSLARCADLWYAGLPDHSISWFDDKAAQLANPAINAAARCGFGDGEIAVAPSGNLYPCERLIGEDSDDNPMRLPGHALAGSDFCRRSAEPPVARACSSCAIQPQCNTTCRCANYVRSGDPNRPDGLLCLLDKVCHRETVRVLQQLQVISTGSQRAKDNCHEREAGVSRL